MTTRASSRASPPRTLGTGLAWAVVLGVIGDRARRRSSGEPIADGLLGDPEDDDLVAAGRACSPGVWLVFKIADITLWLERRPGAFVVADTARPVLGLIGC